MLTAALAPLAAGSEAGKAGPIGLLVILLLGVAVFFLARSMTRHLKRVPPTFDPAPPPTPPKLTPGDEPQ